MQVWVCGVALGANCQDGLCVYCGWSIVGLVSCLSLVGGGVRVRGCGGVWERERVYLASSAAPVVHHHRGCPGDGQKG